MARSAARERGAETETRLLQGKAYQALLAHLDGSGSDLMVVGRQGHHREALDRLGSNAEAVISLARTNVLVAGVGDPEERAREEKSGGLEWSPKAQARLERVPSGPRAMARRAVEEQVRSQGRERVEIEDFLALAARFGMARPDTPEKG